MSGSFAGQAVLLTGASAGIGQALAIALARERARLALVARDAQRLAEVAQQCRDAGGEAIAVRADVGEAADCERAVAEALSALGGLDHLLLNAGIGMITRFEDVTDLSAYERVMRVNYLGCVHLTHHALPALRRSRGLITVISSLTGLGGVPTRTGYAASKHAVMGFYDSLRIELADSGVGVTIVAPDFVVSEIRKRASGADGRPRGHDEVDDSKAMSADECARLTLRAMQRRQRLAILSWRGRLGRWLRLLAPGVVDRMSAHAVASGH